MKIILMGPAHPYRGGLASIIQRMAGEFRRRGHEIEIWTFKVQYPTWLFPGKSQTVEPSVSAPPGLRIRREINTINPLNWWRVARKLRREGADMVLLKYWTPFLAPCFGTIARLLRKKKPRFICQLDNIEPHEHHRFDRPLNRYFLRAMDGFIYMSEQVGRELRAYTDNPALFAPHPLFDHFGERVDRDTACRNQGLDPTCRYALFFGLVRDYKGLDLLLDAFAKLKKRNPTNLKLLIAGEFYTPKDPYLQQIERLGIADDVTIHDRFIPDAEVPNYFCAADFLVLPYRSATQSGVTQIAYHFDLPMIATNVGGLPEVVIDGRTGIVCEPTVASLTHALEKIQHTELLDTFRAGLGAEKKRFSWESMCDRVEEVFRVRKR